MIIPADTSGAAISTGQGQGYAQVLGQSSFDPVVFADTIRRENEGRAKQQVADEIEKRRNNRKFLLDIDREKNINDYNKDAILGVYDDLGNKLAEMMAAGVDLENSLEGRKFKRNAEIEATALGNKGKYVADTIANYREIAAKNSEKYDNKEYNNWLEGLSKIKGDNAAKTLDMQVRYIEENAPFTEPELSAIDYLSRVSKLMPENSLQAGPGAPTITQRNRDQVRGIIEDDLNLLYQDDPEGATSLIEKAIRQGKGNDYAGVIDWYTDAAMKLGPKKVDYPEGISGGGGSNVIVGGYKVPENINAHVQDKDPNTGEAVSVAVTYKDQDIKPMEVVGRDGKTIFFKPAADGFYRVGGTNKSGLKQGDFGVKGKVFRRSNEKVVSNDDTKTLDAAFKSLNTEVVDNGNGTSTVTTFIPLADEVVSWDANSATFKTHLNDFDVKEFVSGWNKKNAGNKSPQPSQKSASKSEIKSLVGKPGYEGYTEQELIDYYKSQGYTIK